jgi:hypothetical protein
MLDVPGIVGEENATITSPSCGATSGVSVIGSAGRVVAHLRRAAHRGRAAGFLERGYATAPIAGAETIAPNVAVCAPVAVTRLCAVMIG